jgi:hypothetical protein
MKKIITFLLIIFVATTLFAVANPETIIEKIESSDLWCFDTKQAELEGKPYIKLTYQTATDFTKKTRNSFDFEKYPNKKTMTYDDVKSVFKSCNSFLFGNSYSSYREYSWKDGKNISYSVQYTQLKTGRPIEGAGTYVIRAFFENSVLTILLEDVTNNIERNKEYDALDDLLYYNDGNLSDKNEGQERTKGYYWKSEESIKTFYEMLKAKDSALPESAVRFQEAAEAIFGILDNC